MTLYANVFPNLSESLLGRFSAPRLHILNPFRYSAYKAPSLNLFGNILITVDVQDHVCWPAIHSENLRATSVLNSLEKSFVVTNKVGYRVNAS